MILTVRTSPGQRIINMEKFSTELASANCGETFSLTFLDRALFRRARRAWGWVNQGDANSFVLVGDPVLCASGDDRDPWIVSNATFDEGSNTISFPAVRGDWADIAAEFILENSARLTQQWTRGLWTRG